MASVFDLIKFSMNGLSHMTELLESCDWDDKVMEEKINVFVDVLQCLPPDQIKEQGFDVWVNETLSPVLELNGLTKNQVRIMLKVILNSREELLFQLNLGEE